MLFIFLFLFSIKGNSQVWVFAGSTTDGDSLFVKKHSASSTKFWLKTISKAIKYQTSNKNETAVGYSLTLYDMNCTDRQLAIRSFTVYNKTGTVLQALDVEEYEKKWKYVVPDSIGEMILNKACELE